MKSNSNSKKPRSQSTSTKKTSKENNLKNLKSKQNPKLLEELAKLKVEKESLQAEAKDWQTKAMRYAAEVQNLQRQHDLDVESSKKKSKKFVLQAILPFLNTLNLAFGHIPKTDDQAIQKFISAIESSWRKLKQDLEVIAVDLIVPQIGDQVNPETMTPVNPGAEDSKVVGVVSIGLKIDGNVVQAAGVMLG